MCLAVYVPAGVVIPEAVFYTAAEENPDGAGYAVQTGLGLKIRRFGGGVHPGRVFDSWNAARESYPAGNAVLHFRWATAGDISAGMSHPFRVGRWAIVHNGHINGLRPKAGESDTAAFCRIVAPSIFHSRRDFKTARAIRSARAAIGEGNKLIALPAGGGDGIIVCASAGYWFDGAWFSNCSGHYGQSWESVKGMDTPQGDTLTVGRW